LPGRRSRAHRNMKARNFRYIRPASLVHAYQILAVAGGDAVPVAGGQSLLAGLNMRLSAPKLLVDIGDLKELTGQSHAGGTIRLGALTRHAELLQSDLVRKHLPLLVQAAPHIGHIAIRNRGTLGGSLAYADPAAELPACAVALGATLVLGSRAGEREVTAEDFFKGLFETDLRPGELIVAVKFPVTPAGTLVGFAELARRHGDFALVGLAATVAMQRGRIDSARLVYFGCVHRAKVAQAVSDAALGLTLPLPDITAFEGAISQDLSPDDTPGLRADTKLHMAKVLTRRALNALSERAA
jgi:aerobic carbon-monoxide dehydrogenase medium subunit